MCVILIIVRELSSHHTKRLMVNFETNEEAQEREIDIATQEITELFRHAESVLKKFGKQGDEHEASQQELTVRNNMQRSLAKKLQGLSMQFRTSQKEYLARLKNQKTGSGAMAFDFLEQEKMRSGHDVDTGFTTEQMNALESTDQVGIIIFDTLTLILASIYRW